MPICVALTTIVSVAVAEPRGGVSLTINNAGFEADTVADGCFAVFDPTGWTLYDPNGIRDCCADVIGGINCDAPYFPGGAPEGAHAGIVFLSGNIGGGPMGLTQVLGDVLQANTTYTLSAKIGNIASGQGPPPCDVFGFFDLDGFPGYQVQLLAGGVVIAHDNNSLAGTIPEGEFRESSFFVTIGEAHSQLGEPLEVRLINLNMIDTPEDPGIEVDFDDVQLEIGCPNTGDLDDDADIDEFDAAILVDVLLEIDLTELHIDLADLNCSGAPDGADIAPFINAWLE
jgi:hapalindole H/12-epi-hapalindole U/12-epi-fischerindole U/hapalindole U synthase